MAIRSKIDSGDWPTPISNEMLDRCCEVAQYNSQSRNALDMIDQKNLWIRMHKQPVGYDEVNFCLKGLNHSSLQHYNGRTALCMQYLRQAGVAVTAETGIWRLWESPLEVPRASEIQELVDPEEIKRIKGNIDDTLENRKDGKGNPLDEALSPPRSGRQRSKSDQRGKGDRGKGDQDTTEAEEKQRLMQARSKAGPPIGSGASSSNRAPSPIRQGTKRPAGAPASPDSIERLAITYWRSHGPKMRKHEVGKFPKTFMYFDKRLHFVLDEFVKGLVFEP